MIRYARCRISYPPVHYDSKCCASYMNGIRYILVRSLNSPFTVVLVFVCAGGSPSLKWSFSIISRVSSGVSVRVPAGL